MTFVRNTLEIHLLTDEKLKYDKDIHAIKFEAVKMINS